jgi:hypothetical protein
MAVIMVAKGTVAICIKFGFDALENLRIIRKMGKSLQQAVSLPMIHLGDLS